MAIQIKYCPIINTFYVEEQTPDYLSLGKKQKNMRVLILKLQDKYEKIKDKDPEAKMPEEILKLQRQYERVTEQRRREKRIYLLKEEDVPEELPIRPYYAPPRGVIELSEEEYSKLLEKVSKYVEKKKNAEMKRMANE